MRPVQRLIGLGACGGRNEMVLRWGPMELPFFVRAQVAGSL